MDGVDGGSEKVKNGGGGGNGGSGGSYVNEVLRKCLEENKGGSGGSYVNEVLRKCLEENKGDYDKCKPKVEAFKSSPTTSSSKKPITPLRLRSGSLTDV